MSVVSGLVATPNRIEMLHRYVARRPKGVTRSDIQKLFTLPDAEQPGRNPNSQIPDGVVSEAIRLQLVSEQTGKLVPGTGISDLSAVLRRRILFGDDTWGQQQVARAAAWFLMRDPDDPIAWSIGVKNLIENDIRDSDGYELSNKERWQQFVYWARYLGFATVVDIGGDDFVIPDPSRIIEEVLKNERPGAKPIGEVLERIGRGAPVFETGTVREEVERMAKRPRSPKEVSRATSRALRMLTRKGVLRFELRSDSIDLMLLTDVPGYERVSQLVIERR